MAHRYTTVAITLHWLIALTIIGQLVLGLTMTHLPSSRVNLEFRLFQLHKSIGITVLALSLARLIWRLLHRPPPPPAGQPAWERFAAQALHVAFYCFMIGMPITGWIIVSTSPFNIPTVLFGVIPWPDLPLLGALPAKAGISASATEIHLLAGYVLIGAILLHVAAALKHQVWDRDEVLWRMIPLPWLKLPLKRTRP